MDNISLLQQIRSQRREKRRKQPFLPTLFARINGLVKAHALGEAFLRDLEAPAPPRGEDVAFDRRKSKAPYEPPLFSLSTEEEYRVTMAIITRVANPYLNFVNSPDEILLCEALFGQNPALPPERLARVHFEGLLLAEVAKTQVRRATAQLQRLQGRPDAGTADPSRLSSLRARVEELRGFILRLEEPGDR
jgi:hypothetical protein